MGRGDGGWGGLRKELGWGLENHHALHSSLFAVLFSSNDLLPPLLTYLESTPDLEETCSESSFPRKLISVLVSGTHLNWKKILPRPRPDQGKVGGSEQN